MKESRACRPLSEACGAYHLVLWEPTNIKCRPGRLLLTFVDTLKRVWLILLSLLPVWQIEMTVHQGCPSLLISYLPTNVTPCFSVFSIHLFAILNNLYIVTYLVFYLYMARMSDRKPEAYVHHQMGHSSTASCLFIT